MPARMIPKLNPDSIMDRGEQVVYRFLRDQLPRNWTVRYHYTYCVKDGLYVRDGEADFIVIAPGHGLMFLEVKQSHGYDCRDGQWFRIKPNGVEEAAESPFDQASKNKFRIMDQIICRDLKIKRDDFPGVYGHAVIYPFARVLGSLPTSQHPVVMLAYKDMGELYLRLTNAFKVWGSETRGGKFTETTSNEVATVLSGEARFVTVAAASVDEDDSKIEQLTRQQYNVFKGLLSNSRIRVEGKAGSGKTLLALWAAQSFASQSKDVLYLCYNRSLAAWLRAKFGLSERIVVRSFHSLCSEYARKAKLSFSPPDKDADADETKLFWGEKSPAILDQALTALGDAARFDVVIVDEAQDFHQDWWLPVQLLLRNVENGPLYIFFDSDQTGVYGHGQAYPAENNFSFELSENCRNTRKVVSYCSRVLRAKLRTFEFSPLGESPEVSPVYPSVIDRSAAAKKLVENWIQEGFAPSRIAILSPWSRGNPASVLSELRTIAGIPVEVNPDQIELWLSNKAIWGSTIRSFKGLEADCILLTDVPKTETSGFSRLEMYVAASRAKHRLAFLPCSRDAEVEIRDWLRTGPANEE